MLLYLSLLLLGFFPNESNAETFEQWKKSYVKRAAKRGIPSHFSSKLLRPLKIDDSVIKKNNNQVTSSESVSFGTFIGKWLRPDAKRIARGKQELQKHADLLRRVEKKYGVEKEIIVALWGVESFYGDITGDYDLIRSLATLAHTSRRKRFFELQLNATFRLLIQGHAKREDLKGSWAGATGQCQFMPSNFPRYARDFDGDGRKDIWTNHADLFASIAYFLKKVGWKKGSTVGTLVRAPADFEGDINRYRSPAQYNQLGFKTWDGGTISGAWSSRRMAEIPLKDSPMILKGGNYDPILVWNRSSLFAAFNILLVEGFNKN